MARRPVKVERSRYRQVRLTITQEVGGRVSYRLHVKGLEQAWDEHTCVGQGTANSSGGEVRSYEDALRLVVETMSGEMLPP